ncbi:hypothetical protein B0J15DRAFT_411114, partial [Fusarium solani]
IIPKFRDAPAKKGGYWAWCYREALRDRLLLFYDELRRFCQDTTSILSAKKTIEWLQTPAVKYPDRPAQCLI